MGEAARRRVPQRSRGSARSVRLAPDEAMRLQAAAQAAGLTPSHLMREAILARCDAILSQVSSATLDDVIGAINVPGPAARDAKRVVQEAMDEKQGRRQL